jgi:hypothetical protein
MSHLAGYGLVRPISLAYAKYVRSCSCSSRSRVRSCAVSLGSSCFASIRGLPTGRVEGGRATLYLLMYAYGVPACPCRHPWREASVVLVVVAVRRLLRHSAELAVVSRGTGSPVLR